MVDQWNEIIADYEQLRVVMQQQWDALQDTNSNERWNQFQVLALEWSLTAQRIERKHEHVGSLDSFPPSIQQIIHGALSSMEALSVKIEEMLTEQQKSDADTMAKVKMKQTTLRSYGGLSNSDTVPLYFDERK